MNALVSDIKNDLKKLDVSKMETLRFLIPRLYKVTYKVEVLLKGIWSIKPEKWPNGVFFGDPNNRTLNKGKPRQIELKSMFEHLLCKFQELYPDVAMSTYIGNSAASIFASNVNDDSLSLSDTFDLNNKRTKISHNSFIDSGLGKSHSTKQQNCKKADVKPKSLKIVDAKENLNVSQRPAQPRQLLEQLTPQNQSNESLNNSYSRIIKLLTDNQCKWITNVFFQILNENDAVKMNILEVLFNHILINGNLTKELEYRLILNFDKDSELRKQVQSLNSSSNDEDCEIALREEDAATALSDNKTHENDYEAVKQVHELTNNESNCQQDKYFQELNINPISSLQMDTTSYKNINIDKLKPLILGNSMEILIEMCEINPYNNGADLILQNTAASSNQLYISTYEDNEQVHELTNNGSATMSTYSRCAPLTFTVAKDITQLSLQPRSVALTNNEGNCQQDKYLQELNNNSISSLQLDTTSYKNINSTYGQLIHQPNHQPMQPTIYLSDQHQVQESITQYNQQDIFLSMPLTDSKEMDSSMEYDFSMNYQNIEINNENTDFGNMEVEENNF